MKGLNYKSTLSYGYIISNQEIERILESDGFNNYELNNDLKIVEYTIDHSQSIRLSQLMYLQEIKLIRMTIAQQIQLCVDIYRKYQQLKQQNIDHNYLSSDRIWLKVTDLKYQFTILPEYLQYTIHFVGYHCPFYERQNYQNSQIKDDQAIKNIIISILQSIKTKYKEKIKIKIINTMEQDKNKEKETLKKDQNKEIEVIFTALMQEGIFKSFEKFMEAYNLIFEKYDNINNKRQRLNFIDKIFSIFNSKRARRIKDVKQNLEQIVQFHYNYEQPHLFEQTLQLTFPKIAKELKTSSIYEYQKPAENEIYLNLQIQTNQIDNQTIDQIINENKESIMKDFKFDLDLPSIKNEIVSQLPNQYKILRYFLNDVKFSNIKDKIIIFLIDQLKKDITNKIAIEALQDYLQLQVLNLDQDLI